MGYDLRKAQGILKRECLFFCILLTIITACTTATWQAPIWDAALPGFQSVPESEIHGTVILERDSPHILVKIDGKLLKDDRLLLELLLTPGEHTVKIWYMESYHRSDGSGYQRSSKSLKRTLDIAASQRVKLKASQSSGALRIYIFK